jgi:hypothetical protein
MQRFSGCASKQTQGVTGSIARHRLDIDHVIMSTSIVSAGFLRGVTPRAAEARASCTA